MTKLLAEHPVKKMGAWIWMSRLAISIALFSTLASFMSEALASSVEHTELILSSGTELGVGGGPQGGFGFVKVCNADKISVASLPMIVRFAMNSLDSTIQGDIVKSTESAMAASWKTAPTSVGPAEIQEYNDSTEKSGQLPKIYRYYYTSTGKISIDDGIISIQTLVSLYIRTTPQNVELYAGPYSGKFFHKRITQAISEGASEISCQ